MIPTVSLQGRSSKNRVTTAKEDDDLHTNHVLIHQGQKIVKPDYPGGFETTNKYLFAYESCTTLTMGEDRRDMVACRMLVRGCKRREQRATDW